MLNVVIADSILNQTYRTHHLCLNKVGNTCLLRVYLRTQKLRKVVVSDIPEIDPDPEIKNLPEIEPIPDLKLIIERTPVGNKAPAPKVNKHYSLIVLTM